MGNFTADMTTTLFGNPHSASASSQRTSKRIDDTRLEVLEFFNASPDQFEVVFTANATAAVKLVVDAFRDTEGGFWYGYHADSHTSLVGARELASRGYRAFGTDQEVNQWLGDNIQSSVDTGLSLFSYPGQSNMTGQRRGIEWCKQMRQKSKGSFLQCYSLYDAAGLVSTSPLDLSDVAAAPDFTPVSFYKIFGFPDLGALILRKASAKVLLNRNFFGGGTVESIGTMWHAKKNLSLAASLEDGTQPLHSIIALQHALRVHRRIYGSMKVISRHTSHLAAKAYEQLGSLRHVNGFSVCEIYKDPISNYDSACIQGPILSFNIKTSAGHYISVSEVEKLATVHNFQLRTGGLCNPGGIANALKLSDDDLKNNFEAGRRCGDEQDIVNGKPTGVLRISLGAMSCTGDVEKFVKFISDFYVEKLSVSVSPKACIVKHLQPEYYVESLSVYPIKSCAAFAIPADQSWQVKPTGLAWDREWCLVHVGTGHALSQKRYPKMALLRPEIDIVRQRLIIKNKINDWAESLAIPLRKNEGQELPLLSLCSLTNRSSTVCGEATDVQLYTSPQISEFFSSALGVPCTLARCPPASTNRHSKPRGATFDSTGKTILLSNESPILVVSRSSVNKLNEDIKARSGIGKTVSAASFRGNIIIAEDLPRGQRESPFTEDTWTSLHIFQSSDECDASFDVLGPCQRCQMVCVDQESAERRQEPFSTLAKTRMRDGKVWFGVHLAPCFERDGNQEIFVRVGDRVTAS